MLSWALKKLEGFKSEKRKGEKGHPVVLIRTPSADRVVLSASFKPPCTRFFCWEPCRLALFQLDDDSALRLRRDDDDDFFFFF